MSTKSTFKKNGGYFIDGVAYMDCKVTGEPVANVGLDAVSVIGSKAVLKMVGMPNETKQAKPKTGRPAGWTLCPSCQITYSTGDDGGRVVYHHCTRPSRTHGSEVETNRMPPADILCARCQDSDTHFECQTCNFRFCFSCSANCWDCRGQFCVECRSSHTCAAPRRPRPWELMTQHVYRDNPLQSVPSDECSPAAMQEHMFVSNGSDPIRFLARTPFGFDACRGRSLRHCP